MVLEHSVHQQVINLTIDGTSQVFYGGVFQNDKNRVLPFFAFIFPNEVSLKEFHAFCGV